MPFNLFKQAFSRQEELWSELIWSETEGGRWISHCNCWQQCIQGYDGIHFKMFSQDSQEEFKKIKSNFFIYNLTICGHKDPQSAFRVDWCSLETLTIEVKLLFVYATNVTSFHEFNTDSVLSAVWILWSYTQDWCWKDQAVLAFLPSLVWQLLREVNKHSGAC